MVQAHTHPKTAWGAWFNQEIMDNLEQSMSEVPETAQILQELAVWAGSWDWSQYSIRQLGQPYRMIQVAAELIAEKNALEESEAMRIVVESLADFGEGSERIASASPFVRCVIDVCGTFDRKEIAAMRSRGFEDQEISEIAGAVALTLFISLITNTPEDEHPRLRSIAFAG
tara:strand:+ start:10792 stop:11304 length:513 start_codon:yes stop_codon:yes gene_type:complete